MPWVRTQICASLAPSESYCICDDEAVNLTPGSPGDTQTFGCLPCGDYGVQVSEYVCCNLSGTVAE